MAASVIAFMNCLRCGEFTVANAADRFLKRKDWKQDKERGQIWLPFSKTDITGRGHWIKYRKMKSNLDPIFWMKKYADGVRVWNGSTQDPLFVLSNSKPLERTTLIQWLRKMAKIVGHPRADKLSGISYRRGGAQALRDQGYGIDKLGRLARWSSEASAARYVTLTDAVVDEFAGAFDKADKTVRI